MACAPPRQIDPVVTAARIGGPLALVALLLAVLGALSVAGGLPGGASIAAGPADAVAAASRLDPLLSRSASRLLGLQPSNPWSRSDDPDGLAPPPAIAPAAPAFPAQTGAAPLHRPVEPAPRRRPLHGSPQSPRAPPLTV